MKRCNATRLFDIIFSTFGILLISPILIITSILLRFTGEGHIFYFQERVGRNGVKFVLFKFATMLHDSPSLGAGDITLSNDPRVLPVGRILRKSKINELPQLFNVLIGDMSLVGPRPLTPKNFNLYTSDIQRIIEKVRPGLTGVGSIFFRDEEKFNYGEPDPLSFYAETIAPYKGDLEKWYIDNASTRLYFKLIFLTIRAVLFNNIELNLIGKNLPRPPIQLEKKLINKFNRFSNQEKL